MVEAVATLLLSDTSIILFFFRLQRQPTATATVTINEYQKFPKMWCRQVGTVKQRIGLILSAKIARHKVYAQNCCFRVFQFLIWVNCLLIVDVAVDRVH